MLKIFLKLFFILGDFFQGVFGGLSDDHPNGSKQECNVDDDCTIDNEKCHIMKLCGPKACQSKDNCKPIGNLNEGQFMAESCDNGVCKYEEVPMMSNGASRIRGFF